MPPPRRPAGATPTSTPTTCCGPPPGRSRSAACCGAAGADPDAIARQVESGAERGQPRDQVPNLTPAAKRALLHARQISRALGSSYIGPEHLLFALAVNPGSAAGRVLASARVTPRRCATRRPAAAGGAGREAAVGHPDHR